MNNEIVKNFCAAFFLKKSDLQEIMAACRYEMTRSLRNVENAKTDLRMLNTHTAKVKVHAVLNDCVQLLAASCVGDSECAMSMIIGDGVNAAYVEDISNFKRDEKFDDNAKFVVINTELSGLGECGSLRRFVTEFDRRLDRLSANPGYQIFEKFVASCYLGEIVRHMIVFLTEKNQLFNGNLPMSLKNPYTFPTKYICEIERDPPHLFYTTEYILREDLKIPNLKMEDLRIVRYVCSAVAHRSACMSAAAAACIVKGIRRLRVTIGVDGCLVRFHPTYAKQMITVMARLVPKHCTFRLKLTEEAGKGGAAIVAAYIGHKK
ncbi:hypothetical protein SprV_0200676000 [Sparganum proliferum]